MQFAIVCLTAFAAAGLTLFSGFGLGSLLLPAFAVFFPAETAVSATAVVHLLNNLFKLALVGRHANRRVLVSFGVPAAACALAGAWALIRLADLPVVVEYAFAGRTFAVTPVKLAIAVLIFVFACFDLVPALGGLAFDRRWIPLGGALSGFFGGLSGHQGALRSAFLIKAGLPAAAFIGTGTACAVLVDLARLSVYGASALAGHLRAVGEEGGWALLVAATGAAFAGSFLGSRWLGRVTLSAVRRLVGALLLAVAAALALGLV